MHLWHGNTHPHLSRTSGQQADRGSPSPCASLRAYRFFCAFGFFGTWIRRDIHPSIAISRGSGSLGHCWCDAMRFFYRQGARRPDGSQTLCMRFVGWAGCHLAQLRLHIQELTGLPTRYRLYEAHSPSKGRKHTGKASLNFQTYMRQ